ncbi:TM2 domain-containing protein [Erythrobacter sp. JK5]|uniref:TM2 domain-containing protein n=1 Tax=Erythrobacter sp. JK5 TaxID=2829500 RepID=UPI001BAC56AE|nr:TM2 domain-containing protein [Erythrobacter sp. JK5]QUL39181.1 TM2 domain-containing protein [Erythrobacter sp. JK5]
MDDPLHHTSRRLSAGHASFGRKGLSDRQPAPCDPYQDHRAAFLAEERARDGARPCAAPHEVSRASGIAAPTPFVSGYAPERSGLKARVEDELDRLFGPPHRRSIIVAYLMFFFASPLSVHRFYCGEFHSAIAQLALLCGSVICFVIFPPLGAIGLILRGIWVGFDFLMIPGMMQRFKDRSGTGRSVMA